MVLPFRWGEIARKSMQRIDHIPDKFSFDLEKRQYTIELMDSGVSFNVLGPWFGGVYGRKSEARF